MLDKFLTNRWLPVVTNLAALLLLIYGAAQWTLRLIHAPTPATATSLRATDGSQSAPDLQSLLAANLFGRATDGAAKDVNPAQLPLSSLNIVLTGVMAQGKASFALLSIDGAAEIPVVIGQEVTAGAILDAVYTDRVILRRGAALESVMLKDSDTALPTGSFVTGQQKKGSPVRLLGGGVYGVDRTALAKNLTVDTLRQATVAPSAGGLVIREVQSDGMFDELGLHAGDVIRSINGQPVGSLDDIARIYGQLAVTPQEAPVSVEVVRSGKTEVLQYQMQ